MHIGVEGTGSTTRGRYAGRVTRVGRPNILTKLVAVGCMSHTVPNDHAAFSPSLAKTGEDPGTNRASPLGTAAILPSPQRKSARDR